MDIQQRQVRERVSSPPIVLQQLLILDPREPEQQFGVQPTVPVQRIVVEFFQGDHRRFQQGGERRLLIVRLGSEELAVVVHADRERRLGMVAEPDPEELLAEPVERLGRGGRRVRHRGSRSRA
jgi:hypothetical protein